MIKFCLWLGYLFLYLPLFLLVGTSFNKSRFPGLWEGFSFRWYHELWNNNELITAFFTSFKIACVSATLALLLGTYAAFAALRYKNKTGRKFLEVLSSFPITMPEVITGLSLLLLFIQLDSWIPLPRGFLTVVIGHATIGMAYVSFVIKARLVEMDASLEEAALDLGASPRRVFFQITLPLIFPSLISGWLLAFVLSLDDVILAGFLSGPGTTTLPLLIFSSLRLGLAPEITALASLMILGLSLVLGGFGLYFAFKKRKVS